MSIHLFSSLLISLKLKCIVSSTKSVKMFTLSVTRNTQKQLCERSALTSPPPLTLVFPDYKDRYPHNPEYILDTTSSQRPHCFKNEHDCDNIHCPCYFRQSNVAVSLSKKDRACTAFLVFLLETFPLQKHSHLTLLPCFHLQT